VFNKSSKNNNFPSTVPMMLSAVDTSPRFNVVFIFHIQRPPDGKDYIHTWVNRVDTETNIGPHGSPNQSYSISITFCQVLSSSHVSHRLPGLITAPLNGLTVQLTLIQGDVQPVGSGAASRSRTLWTLIGVAGIKWVTSVTGLYPC